MNLFDLPNEEKQAHSVNNEKDINIAIKRLIKTHAIMTLRFNGSKKAFGTMILSSDSKDDYFILDSIVPNITYTPAIKNTPFTIYGSYEGIHIEFKNLFFKDGQLNKNQECKLPLPKEMIYIQRRRSFRAPLHISQKIIIDAKNDALAINGRLTNISTTGCQVILDGNMKEPISKNAVFEHATFTLNEDSYFNCGLEIVHAVYNEEKDNTTAGCCFDFFDPETARFIEKFVNEIQLETNRRRFQ